MKNLPFLLFSSLMLLYTSCSLVPGKKEEKLAPEDFNTVEVNNQYKIQLPKYMTKAENLSKDASLQYQNIFKETYTIVITESKQAFIDMFMEAQLYDTTLGIPGNYRDAQLNRIAENMTIKSQSTPVKLTLGTKTAYQVEIDGLVEGLEQELSYLFTFVEGDNELYMIMSWTLKSRKEKYLDTFKEVAQSFRTRKGQ
jgi:hypothetical protein